MNISRTGDGYLISNGSISIRVLKNGNVNLSKVAREFNITLPNKHNVNIRDAIVLTTQYKALNNLFAAEERLRN